MFISDVLSVRKITVALLLFVSLDAVASVTLTGSTRQSQDGNYSISWVQTGTHRLYTVVENGKDIGTVAFDKRGKGITRTYSFKNKVPGQYKYQIRVSFYGGPPALSNAVTVDVGVPVPNAPPTINTANPGGPFTLPHRQSPNVPLSVHWDRQINANSYTLQRSINNGPWKTLQNSSSNSWSDKPKELGAHKFRVRSCNKLNQCSSYRQSGILTISGPIPKAPSSIKYANPGGVSALPQTIYSTVPYSIFWDAQIHAARYELQRRFNNGSWTTIQNTTETALGYTPNDIGQYQFRVRACNAADRCSDFTQSGFLTINTPPLVTPSMIYVSGISRGVIKVGSDFNVNWTGVAHRDEYRLQYQRNSGSWESVPNIDKRTSYRFNFSNPGMYRFRVQTHIAPNRNSGFAVSDEVRLVDFSSKINTDYKYDALGRLIRVELDGSKKSEYTYDASGNRTDVEQR